MPGFDGTGPQGRGRRTGRGLGYCSPQERREAGDEGRTTEPVDEARPIEPAFGFRRRPGRGGRGRGRMNRFKATGRPGWMGRRP